MLCCVWVCVCFVTMQPLGPNRCHKHCHHGSRLSGPWKDSCGPRYEPFSLKMFNEPAGFCLSEFGQGLEFQGTLMDFWLDRQNCPCPSKGWGGLGARRSDASMALRQPAMCRKDLIYSSSLGLFLKMLAGEMLYQEYMYLMGWHYNPSVCGM